MAVFTTKLRKTHNTHIDKLMIGGKKKTLPKNINTTNQAITKQTTTQS